MIIKRDCPNLKTIAMFVFVLFLFLFVFCYLINCFISYLFKGTAHGKGTYFARDAAYSDGYARPSGPSRHKHMYMCKVLTGEYAQGNSSMVSPPPKPNSPTEMYDCVVDNVNQPRVFVVFHDSQAYPEYLITYT